MNENQKRFIILSCATEDLMWQYGITNELKAHYCRKNGYCFRFDSIAVNGEDKEPAFWHRTAMLDEEIKSGNYDYAIYMDVDAWPNDMNKRLESLISGDDKVCCTVSIDPWNKDNVEMWMDSYVNCGIIMFKCCEESSKMIRAWTVMPRPAGMYVRTVGKLHDQSFFNARLLFDEYFYDKVDIKTPEDMNYYICHDGWQDKFLLHAAGCGRGICTEDQFYKAALNTIDRYGVPENDVIKAFREKNAVEEKSLTDEKNGVDTPAES